nr:VTT domain-containing protein [uncultured Dongia sp.]
MALIAVGIALFVVFDGYRFLSLDELQRRHLQLTDFVTAHYVPAVLLFMAVYVLVVAVSLPGSAVLTLAGGFMFGALAATCYIVVAATTGAVILFLAARSALGEPLRARAGPWLAKLSAGFQRNAWSYMLILRLVPLFPFFVVNLVPAFLGVSLRCFAITTFFGIMPATFIYALIGTGLGDVVAGGGNFQAALSPGLLVGLLGLAALSALPIAFKRRKQSHD